MFVVDTNVLVYAADEDSRFHRPCRNLLEGWRAQPSAWYLTWGILYEFLRISTHPRVFREPWTAEQAFGFVDAIVASPSLRFLVPTERHVEVLGTLVEDLPHVAGNLMHDAHTAALMWEHGIQRIYTRETDFHRFPFIETRDPLTDGA